MPVFTTQAMVNLSVNQTRRHSSHRLVVVWVTDTHTEASPPMSPPHEAGTVALEEQLKGT